MLVGLLAQFGATGLLGLALDVLLKTTLSQHGKRLSVIRFRDV